MIRPRLFICSSVLLALGLTGRAHADEHFPFLAQVSKESVNVRAGPNTNFEKIDKLNKGAQVVVLGRNYEWYKVQTLPTTKAYIRSDYLGPLKGVGRGIVSGDNVNIRSSPKAEAASLGEVKKGTVVTVLGQADGWSLLESPVAGTAAWIHQDFLKEVSPDVPPGMLAQAVQAPPESVPANPSQESPAATPVNPWVSIRGTVEVLVDSPGANVHYEIVLGNKSVFLLQDMPHLSFFCNSLVDIEGAVIPDPQKKFMYPLVHVNRIALVL